MIESFTCPNHALIVMADSAVTYSCAFNSVSWIISSDFYF